MAKTQVVIVSEKGSVIGPFTDWNAAGEWLEIYRDNYVNPVMRPLIPFQDAAPDYEKSANG